MTKFKFLSILLSLVSLVGLAFLVSTSAAGLDQGPLKATTAILNAGASQAGATVSNSGVGLNDIALSLADNKDLSTAVAGLQKALKNAKPEDERPPPQQNRIDKAIEKLDEQSELIRSAGGSFKGLTFTDELGVVLRTDSELFKENESIALPPTEAPPLEGEEESVFLEGEGSLIQFAMAGHTLDAITIANGRVFFVAASPLHHPVQKKKIIGATLVDRPLSELPPTAGLNVVLVAGGAVVMGEAPAGFIPPETAPEGAFLAVASDPPAQAPGLPALPFLPFLAGEQQPGHWARGFAVAGAPDVHGYVFSDLTAPYAAIRGVQVMPFVLAILIWLLHAILILLDGRSIRKGVTQLSDFLGQVTQGATEARNLPERKVPGPVRRLTRSLNQVLEHYVGGGGHVQKLVSSPTVDDVLEEAKVEEVAEESKEAPDFDGLEFEGIEDSGTLDLEGEEPEADEIGEASDGYDDSIAELGDEVVDDAAEPEGELSLPEDDTDEAIAHLDDEKAAPTPPPPPPDEIGEPEDDFGAAPDMADRTTEMMQATPDVIEKLKSDIDEKRETAPLPPGLDDELDELAASSGSSGKAPLPPGGSAPLPPPPPSDIPEDGGATEVMQVTPELIAKMKAVADGDAGAPLPPGGDAPLPSPPEKPKPAADDPEAEREAHFKEVYEAFVKTRKECGEKGDLAYDKFAKRLEQSRAAVMQKHKCSDVRFQVYVKNGKAALKATPAK